jgi:hypothetical protein
MMLPDDRTVGADISVSELKEITSDSHERDRTANALNVVASEMRSMANRVTVIPCPDRELPDRREERPQRVQ